MIFVDSAELEQLTLTAIRWVSLHYDKVPATLAAAFNRLQSPFGPHVLITRQWLPIVPSKEAGKYLGVSRQYGDLALIHIADDEDMGVALLIHELTHAVGGTELDAEVIEHLACADFGTIPSISEGEKREFEADPEGQFYVVRYIYFPEGEKRAFWRSHLLWTS